MEQKTEMEKFLEERRVANCRSIHNILVGSYRISELRIPHQQRVSQRADKVTRKFAAGFNLYILDALIRATNQGKLTQQAF